MNSFDYWFRRSAHIFATTFISYYFLPDSGYIGILKRIIVLSLLIIFIVFDIARLKRKRYRLTGLRDYEENRIGSYVYFGIGTSILLLLFPQQIAIPCIVSAALADPVAGELRKINLKLSYLIVFMLSFFIFYSTWLTSPYAILISVTSSLSLTLSELKKFRYLDDDLLMQIVPALTILIFYLVLGKEIMPREIIFSLLEVR